MMFGKMYYKFNLILNHENDDITMHQQMGNHNPHVHIFLL